MDLKLFIQRYRKDWEQLEKTTHMMMKRKGNLTPELLERFETLYHKTSHNLAYSQTYFPGEEVTMYLNELVAKAQNVLYQDQTTSWYQLKRFFGETFIHLLTRQWKFAVISCILFVIGVISSFIAVMDNPLHLYSILPDEMANGIDPNRLGEDDGAIDAPLMSAAIMTNNIQVAFFAFAGGITLGILTVYILIYNGILLGALAALFWQYGKFYDFWAYIVPHGMIELTAIFIAGGSGLMMGYHILVPGAYPRSLLLKREALRSVQLLLGTIPMFVIAGIIEGYITPAAISLEAKYGVAIITVFALFLYIFMGNRRQKNMATPVLDS